LMSNLEDRSGNVKPDRFYVLRFCFGGGRDILVCLMSDARRLPAVLVCRVQIRAHAAPCHFCNAFTHFSVGASQMARLDASLTKRGLLRSNMSDWGACVELGVRGRGESYSHAWDCPCNYRPDARRLHAGDTGACDTGWLECA